jgi:hypothetical protein
MNSSLRPRTRRAGSRAAFLERARARGDPLRWALYGVTTMTSAAESGRRGRSRIATSPMLDSPVSLRAAIRKTELLVSP